MAWPVTDGVAGRSVADGKICSERQHQRFAVDSWKVDIQDVRQAASLIAVDVMLDGLQVVEELFPDLQRGRSAGRPFEAGQA